MKKTKEILIGGIIFSLGVAVVILSIKTSRQSGEIKTLKENLSGANKICDDKNRYIGKILTEFKNLNK